MAALRLRNGVIEGPDLNVLFGQILAAADVDGKMKEPLRRRMKSWGAAVLARMKAEAPDDPETGQSRIERALRTKGPTISRGRKRMTMSFIVDAAKLGASADGKTQTEGRGVAWSLVQHEDLTLKHSRGNAKFMERPFKAHASRVAEIVGEALDEITASLERARA